MAELTNIQIIAGNPDFNGARHYIQADQGDLFAKQDFFNSTYEIADYHINSESRGEGYGKELLKVALEHARIMGALAVTASDIVSRESIDALSRVFGSDSVAVDNLGDYVSPDRHGSHNAYGSRATMLRPITAIDPPVSPIYVSIVDEQHDTNSPVADLNRKIIEKTITVRTLEASVDNSMWLLDDTDRQAYEMTYEAVASLMLQRDRLLNKQEAMNRGYNLEYADEIDLGRYDHILSPVVRHERLEDVRKIDPQDKKRIRSILSDLPFYAFKNTRERSEDQMTTKLMGPVPFPVSRIIGIDSFSSWAGRDRNVFNSNPDRSLDKILDIAAAEPSELMRSTGPDIEIVKDEGGTYWGIAVTDGSHRTAAAKIRGDMFIDANAVYLPDVTEIRIVPGSIGNNDHS